MKNKIAYIALATLLLVAMLAGPAMAAENSVIAVNGSAVVQVAPDIVVVSLGVSETAEDVMTAQTNANTKINAIVAALKEAGIEAKDISTSDYSIYASYDYDPTTGEQKFKGYVASTTLSVKVRDVENAGTYIDTAVKAGANQLNGITFDREDRAEFVDKALALAVEDAARKAGVIATASGATLGSVVSVTEQAQTYDYYRSTANVSYSMDMGAGSTDLQSGMLDIEMKVVVEYSIK